MKKGDANKSIPEQIRDAVQYTRKGIDYRNIAPQEIFIPIDDLPAYIKGVRVHPQADDWYVALIAKLCEKYGLVFFGKSDLYRTAIQSP